MDEPAKRRDTFLSVPTVVTLGVGVVLMSLFVAILIGFRRFQVALEGYVGLHLDGQRQEVLYRLGYPPSVMGPVECSQERGGCWQRVYITSGKDPVNAMPGGETANDYNDWEFDLPGVVSGNRGLDVTFSNCGAWQK